MNNRKRIGLIVNPVAGLGGAVGLKGSDGPDVQRRAMELGGMSQAVERAAAALSRLLSVRDRLELITCRASMGAGSARSAGVEATVIDIPRALATSAADTIAAAEMMVDAGIDLLLFAGGDGTARDIHTAVGQRVAALGIPAGVKMQSAVFALSPACAGVVVASFCSGRSVAFVEREVIELDEPSLRAGISAPVLYGYLRVPSDAVLVQSSKSRSQSETGIVAEIAAEVVNSMESGAAYVCGPGTTVASILRSLSLEKTLAGVDVIRNSALIAADVSAQELMKLLGEYKNARLIVAPIGGQGFLFGRGNQQLSAEAIRKIGARNIIVVATPGKLAALEGRPLLVDTGDDEVDRMLAGHVPVVTGCRERSMYPVRAASSIER